VYLAEVPEVVVDLGPCTGLGATSNSGEHHHDGDHNMRLWCNSSLWNVHNIAGPRGSVWNQCSSNHELELARNKVHNKVDNKELELALAPAPDEDEGPMDEDESEDEGPMDEDESEDEGQCADESGEGQCGDGSEDEGQCADESGEGQCGEG